MADIRRKIRRYDSWFKHVGRRDLKRIYKQVSGLRNPEPRYQVAFIARHRSGNHLRQLVRILRAVSDVSPRPFVLGTTFELLEDSIAGGGEDIWYTVEDLSELEGSPAIYREQSAWRKASTALDSHSKLTALSCCGRLIGRPGYTPCV